MFNWWGNHKIGVVGSQRSGKTVLLTSLLWHLQCHDPDEFKLGKNPGKTRVRDFKYIKNRNHDFNFEANKNYFITEHSWPAKTTDFGLAECHYQRSDQMCERHLTFVDIPGERTADILIWKAKNYAEWVEALCDYWCLTPGSWQIMGAYWKKAEELADFDTLKKEYKSAMLTMGYNHLPITPSTFFLSCDGSMLGDENNKNLEKLIASRPIWSGGELFPVPPAWKNKYPKEYRNLEKTFERYKVEVLKPFLKEVDACDNFIFCVDVFRTLESGPYDLFLRQREFREFVEHFAPAKFKRIFNKIGKNPPRLAFVATKADMVVNRNLDNLRSLLKDFAKPIEVSSGIEYGYFTCAACVSTGVSPDGTVIGEKAICDEQISIDGNIPERWPDRKNWKNWTYKWPRDMKPKVPSSSVPKQRELNHLFEFIVEGKGR